ncbi:hypothetical protein [Klebsiella pneumoniae IS43]|uniref:Uncharacterized protein n=1 Tax=Klebsiella pneumoniae IS43 TaxID=1432552 RepID=W1DCS5_KLEPN|nr:hypothetical protein [Klebsiella pneumoniae IS43]
MPGSARIDFLLFGKPLNPQADWDILNRNTGKSVTHVLYNR